MCSRLLILCFTALSIQQSFAQPAYYIFNDQLKTINDIEQSGNQHLWLATDSGVVRVNIATKAIEHHQTSINGINQQFIRIKVNNNTIWAASRVNGLWKYDGASWTNYNTTSGLLSNTINDFDIDLNGNIWIATANGINKFNGNSFQSYTPFSHNNITAICCDADTVYAGNSAFNEAVLKYDGNSWTSLPTVSYYSNQTNQLKVDHQGRLHNAGLMESFVFVNGSWQQTWNQFKAKVSRNGSGTKLLAYNQILNFFLNNQDTMLNPLYTDWNGQITAISSYDDSTFWCGLTNTDNHFALAKYFIQEENKSYAELHSNSLKTSFSDNGHYFRNPSAGDDGFTQLKAFGRSLIYGINPSITAWQGNIQNRISTKREYQDNAFPTFVPGPISTNRNNADFHKKYSRVWHLTKTEVETHKANFSNGAYTAPEAILNWPGNGSLPHGEEKFVAPFIDQNYNGTYEPALGDYPEIRGDEAVYFVYNSAHGYSPYSHQNLNIEFHTMAYVFDSAGTPAHNTVFFNQKLIFKNQDFDTVHYGLWVDFEVGNFLDDLIGCDSMRNIIYAYNGDLDDEGGQGWGTITPAVGIYGTSGGFSGHMHYNDVPNVQTTEEEKQMLWLKRRWEDGTPMRLDNPSGFFSFNNGNGYLPASTAGATNWHFNDTENWYYGGPYFADKGTMAVMDLIDIKAGDEMCLDYAISYAIDSSFVDPSSSINEMKYYVNWIRDFYWKQQYQCAGPDIGISEDKHEDVQLNIFPNPNSGTFNIDVKATQGSEYQLQIYNSIGKLVKSTSILNGEKKSINLSGHSAGLYLAVLINNGNILKTQKVILY